MALLPILRGVRPRLKPPRPPFELNKDSPQAQELIAWWPCLWAKPALVLDRSLYRNGDLFDQLGATLRSVSKHGFVGAEVSWSEAGSGERLRINPGGQRGPLKDIWRAGNDFSFSCITQVIAQRSQSLWFQSGAGDSSVFLRVMGQAAENVVQATMDQASGVNTATSTFTKDQKTLRSLLFITVTIDRTNLTMTTYAQGGFPSSVAIFDEDYATSTPSISFGGGLSRWNHVIFADIRIHGRVLSPAEVWHQFTHPWDLYWKPNEVAYSFPLVSGFAQAAFRGREDDGSEAAATWKEPINTDFDQIPDQNFRTRFLVQ